MFGISGTELFIIGVFALIIFGPDKIPALARTVGRFMKEFKKVQGDVEAMIRTEMVAAEKSGSAPAETPGGVESAPEAIASEFAPAATPAVFGDDVDEEEEEEE